MATKSTLRIASGGKLRLYVARALESLTVRLATFFIHSFPTLSSRVHGS